MPAKPINHEECQKYLSQLSEYIDGELDPELCKMLEAHLAGCKNCTIIVNTLRRTIELYHDGQKKEELPTDLKKRLFARLSLDNYLK